MKILDDLISGLDLNTPVRDIRQGVFHTGVLTRNCGLAATLPRDALRQKPPMVKGPGFLAENTALELAGLAYSESILEAAMGMAAINSVLETEIERCVELNASNLIMEKGEGKRVAIVGHFPFLQRVRGIAKQLWVIEKNPREGDFSESESLNLIPKADVVGITGSAFTNHTIEHLLGLCTRDAYVIVLGDTVPLSSVLFDYRIDAVCGTKVINADLALKCVSQGANFRQIKGTRRLSMIR